MAYKAGYGAYQAARFAALALPAAYAAVKNFAAGSKSSMGRAIPYRGRSVPRTSSKFPYRKPSGSVTRRGRRIGSRMRSKSAAVYTRNKKRKRSLTATAYHCKYFKRTHGKKHSRAFIRNRLVDSSVTQVRLRHSYMSDWSADDPTTGALSGALFLKYSSNRDANAALNTMPVKMFNLSSTAQGNSIAQPFWELVYNTTDNGYQWFNGYGLDQAASARQAWVIEDKSGVGASTVNIRRKGLLRWSRCRLQFYGKTRAPTKITVQIVKFAEDEHCPEYYTLTSGYTAKTSDTNKELLNSIVKPLINNPISTQVRLAKPAMKVLKEYVIEIDPTKTTENDADVNRRVLDIFNRWDRVVNLTAASSTSAATTLATLDDANKYPALANGYGNVPNKISDSIYLLIKSMQPKYSNDSAPLSVASVTDTASMDWNVQTCWQELSDGAS